MTPTGTDIFLSKEDLDLQNLTDEELANTYQAWLKAAAATDAEDQHFYSHGVFLVEPGYDHLLPEYAHLRELSLSESSSPSTQVIHPLITAH
ncbi:MAG: hypothetical protein HC845_00500 [Akkermansiaceae bacterium]|nr:hypothetical protein [Akkermansiaceae bacterium]